MLILDENLKQTYLGAYQLDVQFHTTVPAYKACGLPKRIALRQALSRSEVIAAGYDLTVPSL